MSEKKRFLLRIDGRIYDAMEKWAADELRSVNSQIEYVLQEALRRQGRLKTSGAAPSYPEDPPVNGSSSERDSLHSRSADGMVISPGDGPRRRK